MTHVFKHPKFYRIPRDNKGQAISKRQPTGESERATWSGPQASTKLVNACIDQKEPQAPSAKQQAPSAKLQKNI